MVVEEAAVSAVILAGGASTRMGFNKALAELVPKVRLVDAVVSAASRLSSDVIVVTNEPIEFPDSSVRVVGDIFPGMGSLAGLHSGLVAARAEHALLVGCDMPFLNAALWRYMLRLPRDYDVLIPRIGVHFEPLHAVYSKGCLEPIRSLLERNIVKVTGFLEDVRVRYLLESEIDPFDPAHQSFMNVNTPVQLETARAIWAAGFAAVDECPQA